MSKVLIAGTALAVLSTVGMVLFQGGVLMAAGDAVPTQKVSSPPKTGFGFLPYDKPRPLPEFRFTDGDGRVLTLADFRGKVVLLNVWATWCPPCREEMPTLDRLQAKLGGPDFEVIVLSIDQEGVPVVKDFYQELGVKALRIYVEPSGNPPPELNVLGLPTTLLIDQQGREIGWKAGPAEWDSPEVEALIRWYQQNGNADK